MKIKLNEGLDNPTEKTAKGLADKINAWYDFDTNYIDDGGQRRAAERKNQNVVEWFSEHPTEVKKEAYTILKSMASKWGGGYSSEVDRIFGKKVNENVNEDKSWKRFLDPYTWFKSNDMFQHRFKNVSPSVVEELIKITKKNGHGVLIVGKNAFAQLDKNPNELEECVWKYYNGVLYYTNLRNKSIYDTLIPKLVNSKNELKLESVNEDAKIVNEVTVTRIPNFNLESDAYIVMLYLLKNNSEFKKAATNAGIDLFSGANTKTVFGGLHNNLKKVITPQIIKSVVQTLNQKRKVLFIDDTDIQKGVHNDRFAGLLALGVIDSFINDPVDTKLLKDLGNAKLNDLANQFSIGRGKMKLGAMLGNKGF